jgi:hypothetical protein
MLFLDGNTYKVLYGKPANYYPDDDRWNPNPAHPHERIAVSGGTTLEWYDVVQQQVTRSWTLPFAVDGIGSYEGNPSNDGRYVLLNENNPATNSFRMFLVDMDPPGGTGRIGPAYDLARDGQMQPGWVIDWVSVSASGKFAVVRYQEDGVGVALRVFDINPTTLALTPRPMPTAYPGMVGDPAQGFIYTLGHADLTLDNSGADVIVGREHSDNVGKNVPGIRTVNGNGVGHVVMVRLSDGLPTSLTDPKNEAEVGHVSARNLDRPGWVYISYEVTSGARFSDEVVALSLDGTGSVQRLAFQHSDTSAGYRAEPMAVPSRDGLRVVFASNWALNGNGVETDYQDYIVATRV